MDTMKEDSHGWIIVLFVRVWLLSQQDHPLRKDIPSGTQRVKIDPARHPLGAPRNRITPWYLLLVHQHRDFAAEQIVDLHADHCLPAVFLAGRLIPET
jgi:hypothetical protein